MEYKDVVKMLMDKVNVLMDIASLIKSQQKEIEVLKNKKCLQSNGGNKIIYEFVKTSATSYKVIVTCDKEVVS